MVLRNPNKIIALIKPKFAELSISRINKDEDPINIKKMPNKKKLT